MFKNRQLEEGTLMKRSNRETNCYSRCVSLIQDFCLLMVRYVTLLAFYIYLHARPLMPWGQAYFLVLSVMAIILDPLFFYIPVVNQAKTCIEFDQSLIITITVLRSIFDLLKVIYLTFELRHVLRDKAKKGSRTNDASLWLSFFIHILAALPVLQVLVIFQKMRTELLFPILCLVQYFPRTVQTYRLFKKTESAWAIIMLNLLTYMIGAHVFGALWYFYAIEKVSKCWKKACTNHTRCGHSFFYCHNGLGDYNFLNDFCPRKTGNTTSYDFGLYNGAIQSGILEETDFTPKFLHCFRWGLQNLSAFGQNLEPSTSAWENIFAICMTIFGVVLFVFLIGKMQIYLQSHSEKSQKTRQTWQEIEQWSSSYHLSTSLKWKMRIYKQNNWQETKRINVEKIFNDLPPVLGKDLKCQLCLNLLRKVEDLKELNNVALDVLCDFLKPVFYAERTLIIREGEPIDEMLFVLKGNLYAYTARNERQNEFLNDGAYCGEQIINWAKESSSELPISSRNIQALTNVEAFSLKAHDLKLAKNGMVIRRNVAAFTIQSYWRLLRNLPDRRPVQSSKKKSKLSSVNHRIYLLRNKIRLSRQLLETGN